ncbi:hypothetical protein E2C01_046745 [Portunus trituberculatus]|uniref:Uncharacterized protein n=1 Tax=Portunus trituberculatus TaxID=210409 RepID=A0A5B7G5Y6_PORTR|nr:hypothetical protein [Portunus trituberculatus]
MPNIILPLPYVMVVMSAVVVVVVVRGCCGGSCWKKGEVHRGVHGERFFNWLDATADNGEEDKENNEGKKE